MTTYQVLLGIAQPTVASEAATLIGEDPSLAVVDTAPDASAVTAALATLEIDVVVIHEDLGPLPFVDLAREISVRFPQVGVVLAVRDPQEVWKTALQAGVRDVVSLPLQFEELQSGLRGAGAWSRAVRERISTGVEELAEGVGGAMIAVAGAKGGVGATTLAVHLALEAASDREQSVCLVDFDLQAGDIGALLDLTHRRSVSDLVEVADDVTSRQLEDTLYKHPQGVRVLLAPKEGEQAEEVGAPHARQILGGIKFRHDVVVVDVGTTVTEGNAVAVEMADEVIVVTTPDVPALRAANRLTAMWERLQVRKREDVKVVVNRVNKALEVQPDLVKKVVGSPLTKAVIPSAFKELEPAANTGVPERLAGGSIRKAYRRLAEEMGISRQKDGRQRAAAGVLARTQDSSSRRGQLGQVAVETMGLALLIGLVVLLLWQMILTGYTYVLAGHAAREGARELAVGSAVEPAATEDVPEAWLKDTEIEEGRDYVEVTMKVPAIVPGLNTDLELSVRQGTVVE